MIAPRKALCKLVSAAAVLWLGGASAAAAERTELVFPHVVDGEGIRMEIQFSNPGGQRETGVLLFRASDGQPQGFWLGGALVESLSIDIAPGGVWSIRSDSRGEVKIGYAVFVSDRADTQLAGTLIFTLGDGFQLSVPASEGQRQGHFLVERTPQLGTGVALTHTGDGDLNVLLTLLDAAGDRIGEQVVTLEAASKKTFFLSQQFEELDGDDAFQGSLHLKADRPFHLLGLRQQANGSLAGLAGSDAAFPGAASQILFLVDSKVNPRDSEVDQAVLANATVRQITGLSGPLHSPVLRIENTHPTDAVTVQVRLLNDRCQDVLRFLMVLECGAEALLEPLDSVIPGSSLRTSQLLFGSAETLELDPISALDFGDGRFIVEVQAVGAALDEGPTAQILFPNELAPVGKCNVTPLNTGPSTAPAENLWICNARPMSFDYLVGSLVREIDVEGSRQICRGRMLRADSRIERASYFLSALDEDAEGCLQPGPQPSCRLRRILSFFDGTVCAENDIGVVLAVRSSDSTYTLRR